MSTLDSKIPDGPIADKWTKYKDHINLVNPANKRNIDIIVVGTGLAGGSAAATLAELGYNVKAFAYQGLYFIPPFGRTPIWCLLCILTSHL